MKRIKSTKKSEIHYQKALEILEKSKIPFMIGGGFALRVYSDIHRDTKDLDIFCKAGDYPEIIDLFSKNKFKTEITDARWIAKVFLNNTYIDFIFGTPSGVCLVDDSWFKKTTAAYFFGIKVKVLPAEELLWCKVYIQDRNRFDGADVNHLILKYGKKIDWKHVLIRFEAHWELLLAQLINFNFVYPSERAQVPKWLMEELLKRLEKLLQSPVSQEKVCRGHLISRYEYEVDFKHWRFENVN